VSETGIEEFRISISTQKTATLIGAAMFGKCGARMKMDTEKQNISYNAGKRNC